MKLVYLLALLCLMAAPAWATHLLGGQIQARNLSGSNYEITVVLYLDEASGRSASELLSSISVCMGDGSTVNIARQSRIIVFDQTASINRYRFTYTYNGPGVYRITTEALGRTAMTNLTLATESPFALSTMLQVNNTSRNSTPVFEISPDFVQVGTNQRAALSYRATDSDGDSLVYLLTTPLTRLGASGCGSVASVSGYRFPNAVSQRGTYKLNARTGELVWDAPTQSGQYVATVLVQEWRSGILISESYVETFIRVMDKTGTPTTIPPYEPAAQTGALVLSNEPEAETSLSLTILPNPVSSQFVARLRSTKATTARLQLLDLSGRVVAEKALTRPDTEHESVFVTEELPSGMYVLRANVGGKVVSRKIMKQ